MLMPSSASTWNIFAATPAWLRMPTPTIETLAISSSVSTPVGLDRLGRPSSSRPCALARSALATVKVRSVLPSCGDVLDDHVDDDVPSRRARRRSSPPRPGMSGTPRMRDLRLVLVVGDPADHARLPSTASSSHTSVPGSSLNDDFTHSGTLYFIANSTERICSTLAPERRQLEHLLVADAVDLARRRAHVRIGGVDAVDVGVDLAGVGLERRRDRHRRGVRAAAAERGDVALLVDALEAGDHRDLPLAPAPRGCGSASMLLMRALVNALSVRIRHWWPRKLRRLAALRLDGQRDQPDGDLLAGGDDHVLLALARAAR